MHFERLKPSKGNGMVCALVGLLLVLAAPLWAQGTTGKVQGTVLDPTGQAVANAQVYIEGTSFAALTNEDGFYFFNNVPAGTYSLRAQFIGYQPALVTGVRVLADQTITVPFNLTGAVELEAFTVTAAATPIVPRDQVASKAIVTGEDVDQLPVNDALSLVQLQPGVVSARGGAISIRGSRANEAVVYVDGAPVRSMDTGGSGLRVASNALAEVSVTTGAMEASFGDAQAGVISLVTRSGGPGLSGSFAYETDEPLGQALRTGYNRFEGSLAGPLLGNLTFSLAGTVNGGRQSSTRKGADVIPSYTFAGLDTVVTELRGNDTVQTFVPNMIQWGGECDPASNLGYECQGRIGAYAWSTDVRGNAKLQLTYGSGSRISLSGLTQVSQNFNGNDMRMDGAGANQTTNNAVVMNWVQQVFRGAESELAFDLNLSYQRDLFLAGLVDRNQDLGLRDQTMGIHLGGLDFVTDWDRFSPADPALHGTRDSTGGWVVTQLKTDEDWDMLIENMRYDRGTLRSYLNRTEVNTRAQQRMNGYGVTGNYNNYGVNEGQNYRYERRYVGRANVDWQADRYNRFKFGVEGTVARIGRWEMGWTAKSFGNGYTGDPYKVAAYGQDRIDLGDVVVEFGLRWDQFDTRTIFPLVPGRIFNNPAFNQDGTVESMTCTAPREECSLTDYVWYQSPSHTSLAPRVRVSFPVTDRTGFRLSYAHQTQVPDLFNMYNGTNNDLGNTNTNDQFGGDADFGKTIMFEFGIRHAFSPDMVLDVSAYNKDKVSDITYRTLPFFDTFSDRTSNVNVITNADFGNVRGVDVQLIRRFGDLFSGQVSYTLQNSKSTGSDPTDFLNGISRAPFGVTGERQEAPQTTLRTRDDRRHNIQGSFTMSFPQDFGSGIGALLRNVGLFGTFQVRSGLPYTRLENNGRGNTSGGGFGLVSDLVEPLQSSETPWEKYLDLRVTKGFRLGPADWTIYADMRNVLNLTNTPTVFAETGDVVNEEYFRVSFLEPQLLTMEQDAKASGAWGTHLKDAGEPTERTVQGINLTDLAGTCPNWAGGDGPVGCVMLQRTEQRFGNGDGFYDLEEQTAAITAFYNDNNSPAARFYGSGRLIRLGLQLSF